MNPALKLEPTPVVYPSSLPGINTCLATLSIRPCLWTLKIAHQKTSMLLQRLWPAMFSPSWDCFPPHGTARHGHKTFPLGLQQERGIPP